MGDIMALQTTPHNRYLVAHTPSHTLRQRAKPGLETSISLTIALSMLCVIVVSALVGTFVPIYLDRNNIDPAIATGPFITTSNDIFGIFLFFYIAKVILGF